MNKIKLSMLVLAVLALAALLTLFFFKREVCLPWAMPAAPVRTMALPAKPAAQPVKEKMTVRKRSSSGQSTEAVKAPGALGKPGIKRKKRVSRLQEPGEALGGSVLLDLPDKTTDALRQKN